MLEQIRNLTKLDEFMVLLNSHKQALLDALCDKIIHINSANQILIMHNCGHSAFHAVLESEIQHSSKTLHQTQDNFETAGKSLKKIQTTLKKRKGVMAKIMAQNADKRSIKGKDNCA